MSQIVVLIPVLGRPKQCSAVFESVRENSADEHRVLFLCSPYDIDATVACFETEARVEVVPWKAGPGDWARKINYGLAKTKEPYLLLGATDLKFHPGWDTAALEVAEQDYGVVGTNDLGNATVMRGHHSTHPLCSRQYANEWGTCDERNLLVHEGYAHQWVDTELVETAKIRGQWAFARGSVVEHLHPFWHKGEMDATYEKALSTSREDHRYFIQRRRIWERQARGAALIRP